MFFVLFFFSAASLPTAGAAPVHVPTARRDPNTGRHSVDHTWGSRKNFFRYDAKRHENAIVLSEHPDIVLLLCTSDSLTLSFSSRHSFLVGKGFRAGETLLAHDDVVCADGTTMPGAGRRVVGLRWQQQQPFPLLVLELELARLSCLLCLQSAAPFSFLSFVKN